MSLTEVSHAMKDLGYRFQEQSIRAALLNSSNGELREVAWRTFTINRSPGGAASLRRSVGVAPSKAEMDQILIDVRRRVSAALERREMVLRRSARGLSDGDPIFTDGSQPPPQL